MARRKRDRIIAVILVGMVLCLVAIVAFANEAKSEGKHDTSTVLWFFGGLQAIQTILWGWIKIDIKDLWKRANNHGHSIECEATGCKPKTTGVLIWE